MTDGGDGFSYDHAAWIEPTLSGPKGTLKLTDRNWRSAKAGWGRVQMNRTADDKPLTLKGAPIAGIGTHSVSIIEFDVPAGYDTFRARGVMTSGNEGKGSVEFAVLTEAAEGGASGHRTVSVPFAELGISGSVRVRDIWKKEDMGVFAGSFSQDLPAHGAGLYRVSPKPSR
ncbi:hypothetical protein EON81_15575 [bacterium]|nr:MAG: hypothetical protein EON81_15575 [bacterium]